MSESGNVVASHAQTSAAHSAIKRRAVVFGDPVEIRPGRVLDIATLTSGIASTKAAPTVFLAHGGGGNKNQWRYQWRALDEAGHSAVAWDFLGHGASPRPSPSGSYGRSSYDGNETLNDYLAIYDRYRGKRNILVGHSMGSGATLALLEVLGSQNRLGEISAVLLLGTQPTKPDRGPLLRLPAFLLEAIKPWLAKSFERAAWHRQTDRDLVAYENRLARGNAIGVMQALLRTARWGNASHLATLPIPPITVIAGAEDGITPPAAGQALSALLPSARFVLLERSGHQIMLEQPDEVNALLFDALRDASPSE